MVNYMIAFKILPNQSRAFHYPAQAWAWAMSLIDLHGDMVRTEDGQLTKEIMNLMVTVLEPGKGYPIPGSEWDLTALNRYAEQLLSPENPGFEYTYGERLRKYPDSIDGGYAGADSDQLEYIICKLRENPLTRRAIAITWIPDVDRLHEHVPCLQSVDFLYRQDKLHLVAYFRSWDVGRAMVPNVYGLSKLLDHVAEQTWMKSGSLTCMTASAHVYER